MDLHAYHTRECFRILRDCSSERSRPRECFSLLWSDGKTEEEDYLFSQSAIHLGVSTSGFSQSAIHLGVSHLVFRPISNPPRCVHVVFQPINNPPRCVHFLFPPICNPPRCVYLWFQPINNPPRCLHFWFQPISNPPSVWCVSTRSGLSRNQSWVRLDQRILAGYFRVRVGIWLGRMLKSFSTRA